MTEKSSDSTQVKKGGNFYEMAASSQTLTPQTSLLCIP